MDGLDELWIGHPSRGETRTSLPQPARRQILNALDYKEEIHRTSVSQPNEDARFHLPFLIGRLQPFRFRAFRRFASVSSIALRAAMPVGKPDVVIASRATWRISPGDAPFSIPRRTCARIAPSKRPPIAIPSLINSRVLGSRGPSW